MLRSMCGNDAGVKDSRTTFLSYESRIWLVPVTGQAAADTAYDAWRDQPSRADVETVCEQVLQSDIVDPREVVTRRACNRHVIQGAVPLKTGNKMAYESVVRNLVAVRGRKKMEDACSAPQHCRVDWVTQLSRSGRMAIVAMSSAITLLKGI